MPWDCWRVPSLSGFPSCCLYSRFGAELYSYIAADCCWLGSNEVLTRNAQYKTQASKIAPTTRNRTVIRFSASRSRRRLFSVQVRQSSVYSEFKVLSDIGMPEFPKPWSEIHSQSANFFVNERQIRQLSLVPILRSLKLKLANVIRVIWSKVIGFRVKRSTRARTAGVFGAQLSSSQSGQYSC